MAAHRAVGDIQQVRDSGIGLSRRHEQQNLLLTAREIRDESDDFMHAPAVDPVEIDIDSPR